MIYHPRPLSVAKVSARKRTAVAVPMLTLSEAMREGRQAGTITKRIISNFEAPRDLTESKRGRGHVLGRVPHRDIHLEEEYQGDNEDLR